MKKYLFVANWKLNGSIKMISNYLNFLKLSSSFSFKRNIIAIAPPTIYLHVLYKNINSMNITLVAQNVDIHSKGAFTGETSILMLQDVGVKYVIIGHSERRLLHHETNDMIAKKFHLVKTANLTPILCVGETEKEKNNGQTKIIIEKQLNCILTQLGKSAFKNTVIAYEPVWAIGTGLSADPNYVQSIHKFIRNYIEKNDPISAESLLIQYGGSIKSINSEEFIQQPDIDGLLIGNASLDFKEFLKIVEIGNRFITT